MAPAMMMMATQSDAGTPFPNLFFVIFSFPYQAKQSCKCGKMREA